MGYQALRDRGKVTETDSGQSEESDGSQRWPSRADVGPSTVGPTTKEDIEEYYGREVSSVDELQELQRLEKGYGGQVLRWIDEGIPIGAMGHKTKMQRFRDRKGTPVPWDIEHFNRLSRMDNTGKVNRDRRRGPDGDAGVPDTVRGVISSPGRPLDTSIQRAVEERMGDSLGDVRIHTGPKAAAAADQINARAFTVGNHVAFGAGEYDPESAEGQHVLAHELAHVRQQTGGDLSTLPQKGVQLEIGPDPELEREAEETAQRVMSGGKLGIQKLSDTEVHVQRFFGFGSEIHSSGSESVDINPDELVEEVRQLRRDVNELQAPDRADKKLGVEAGKGTMGALGGVAGGVIGTALAPGVGTVTGQAVGTVVGGALGGAAGAVYERNFDDATAAVNQQVDDTRSYLDQLIEEKVRSVLSGATTSGVEGVAESRGDR
ncbi:DUF4157 domain-containing protein [Halobaculum sp. MBLA0147]|uniref:eCIS core domain-containing protein n=1 Tax=Halobaculum sp. MBLA0147 TaxID=3079934 RepID=UPI0035253D85